MTTSGFYIPPTTPTTPGTDDQQLSYDDNTKLLSLEDGGPPVDFSDFLEEGQVFDAFGNPIP